MHESQLVYLVFGMLHFILTFLAVSATNVLNERRQANTVDPAVMFPALIDLFGMYRLVLRIYKSTKLFSKQE